MTWATTDDVYTYTGETVTAAQVTAAESDITVYANRTPDASSGMSPRDLYWLKIATCYQAVWRPSQPGLSGRQSVSSFSQDGISVSYGSAEWKISLAPMAARALKNLSWKADRTSRVPNVRYPRGLGEYEATAVGDYQPGFLAETFDEASHWNPL